MFARSPLLSALLLVLFNLPAGAADEWPQFRGPNGQGHAVSDGLPLTWSETENVKWKCAIAGEGWSSPVVSGNQVWMTTATEEGKSLRVVSVDLASGKLLADAEIFHVEKPATKNALNSYASPTPVIEGGRLYVNFGRDGTACLDAGSGAVLWKREDITLDHGVGAGSSLAIYKDKLLVPCDGMDVQYLLALDKQTGKTLWKTERSYQFTKPADMRKAFSTPLAITVNGADQIVIPTAEHVYAYQPETGKEIWSAQYLGFSMAPRPVYGNGLVYICTAYGGNAVLAIRPDGTGDVTATHVAWKTTKQTPTQSSPVLVGNRLYMVSDSGAVSCLNAVTGADVWRQSIGGKFSASLLAAPGRIYFFDRDGTTTVVAAADTFKILAQNKLESGCMASAAVAGNALLLRTKTHLYRLEK